MATARRVHENLKHYGVRRTLEQLQLGYWWPGMAADAVSAVRDCVSCSQQKASFLQKDPHLHPLPIKGLFFRFGVDLAGPLPTTANHHVYALICIDHFSKLLTLVALPDKKASTIRDALLVHVFSRFGAPAELLTDRGSEFRGEVDAMLQAFQIRHRTTSANHPQADGLAERAVQTVKNALRRNLEKENVQDWDQHLPLIALGYNISRQKSLGFSPYYIVYGREAALPFAARADFAVELQMNATRYPDVQNEDALYQALIQRHKSLARDMPIAAGNLLIAQERDTLRYAETRSGAWVKKHEFFKIGDFVYGRRRPANTLQRTAAPYILRVVNITADGMLVLQGRCGRTVRGNPANWAPCKLLNIRSSLDADAVRARIGLNDGNEACEWCRRAQSSVDKDPLQGDLYRDAHMVICDSCGSHWHHSCALLPSVPEGDWDCPYCSNTVQSLHIERHRKPVIANSAFATHSDVYQRFVPTVAASHPPSYAAWASVCAPEVLPSPERWLSNYF